MTCPIQGTATVRRVDGEPEWIQCDPEIHIAKELWAEPQAHAFIGQRYAIGETCPYSGDFHARLIEEPS